MHMHTWSCVPLAFVLPMRQSLFYFKRCCKILTCPWAETAHNVKSDVRIINFRSDLIYGLQNNVRRRQCKVS